MEQVIGNERRDQVRISANRISPQRVRYWFPNYHMHLKLSTLKNFFLNVANLLEKYNDLEELFENGPLNEKRFIKWKTAM